MRVELLESLESEDNRHIRVWHDVLEAIDRTDNEGGRTEARQNFVDSHANTIRLVSSADYHYHNLSQIYEPDITTMDRLTTIWVQIEAESVVFVLYSALESLMQEVNLAYKLGIDEDRVHIYHRQDHRAALGANCARCELDRQEDVLSDYFRGELSSDWF